MSRLTTIIYDLGKSAYRFPWFNATVRRDEASRRRASEGPPTNGEKTKDQGHDVYGDVTGYTDEAGDCADAVNELLKKFPCPPASYTVWRMMDNFPTNSLVRGTLLGEVLSVPRSYIARKDVPDELVNEVEEIFEPLMLGVLSDAFVALSLRWAPFEVEWGQRTLTTGQSVQAPVFFKPLLQDITYALMSPGGRVVGLRQWNPETGKPIDLIGPKSFVYANEAPTGTPFGKSRHEDVRVRAWWPWIIASWMGQLIEQKASGRVFHVKGPNNDAEGSKKIATNLSRGISTYSSNFINTARPTAQGTNYAINPELAKTSAFHIEQFDLGNYAPSNTSILNKMRYYDSLMTRAWRKPERSLLEGQHGTKAEAEAHTESSRSDGEVISMRIAEAISQQTINEYVVRRAGEKYRDAIRMVPGSLVDRQKSWDEKVMDATLQDPEGRRQSLNQIDQDALFSRRGIPKKSGLITVNIPKPEPTAPATGTPKKPKAPQPTKKE